MDWFAASNSSILIKGHDAPVDWYAHPTREAALLKNVAHHSHIVSRIFVDEKGVAAEGCVRLIRIVNANEAAPLEFDRNVRLF